MEEKFSHLCWVTWADPCSNYRITNKPFYHYPFWIPEGNRAHRVHCAVSPEMDSMGGLMNQMSAILGWDAYFSLIGVSPTYC
jgi:hypothetical protein